MALTKNKVVLGAADPVTVDAFNKFNTFVIGIIDKLIDNKKTSNRQLAKVLVDYTVVVYIRATNGNVTVAYHLNDDVKINKTFTNKADVKTEFDKLVLE